MVKWQDILKYGGTGTIGLFFLLAMLVNLTGMTYSSSGDIVCESDCYSEVYINSTYWNICVEHSGIKDVVYKKSVTSTTLWVNLDKIDEFIQTTPKVKVELLVPATGNKWRNVKDGDCIIKRITKSNPKGSKIQIHGIKSPQKTIKWSLILKSYQSEDIIIEPYWHGINITISNFKSCLEETSYFNETIPVYGDIIKYRNTYGVVWSEINQTFQWGINGTELYYAKEIIGNEIITKSKTECVRDTSYLNLNFGTKTLVLNYSKYDFNCSNTDRMILCDSKIDGNGNGKLDIDLLGNRLGETYFLMNATSIIFDNSGDGTTCKTIELKGIEFNYCSDKSLSKFLRRLEIE